MNKHIELIKAWADGAKIQRLRKSEGKNSWTDVKNPIWSPKVQYRIKPDITIKTPDGDFAWKDVKTALNRYFRWKEHMKNISDKRSQAAKKGAETKRLKKEKLNEANK
jgi:hypothetical protein